MFFVKSLRARLTLFLSLAMLICTLIISAYFGVKSVEKMQQTRLDLLSQLAQSMGYQLDKDMNNRGHEIQLLTSLASIQSPQVPLAQKQAVFEQLRQSYPYYSWIGMADAQGNILAGTDGLLVGKNVQKRSWFIEGSKGIHLGSVHDAFLLAKIMPKPKWDDLPLRLVDVSAPILDESGQLLGVICGHLGWDWAFEMRAKLLGSPMLKGVDLLVARADGHLLMGTPALPSSSIQLDGLQAFKQVLNSHSAQSVEPWHDQVAYLTSVEFMDSQSNAMLNWVVVARETQQQLFTEFVGYAKHSLWVLGLGMLVFGMLIWQIVARATRKLEALTDAANVISAEANNRTALMTRPGDNSSGKIVTLPLYHSKDEVGILSQSLHQMVNELKLLGRVFTDSSLGVMIADKHRRILKVNQAFIQITGYEIEDVLGKTPSLLKSGRHHRAFYSEMYQTLRNTGRWQGEIWNKNKQGLVYPEWLNISLVKNAEGAVSHYIGIFSDVSERKETEKQLQFLANHDVLTGLGNRALLNHEIEQALQVLGQRPSRESVQSGLIFLDLNFFKSINDSLGHMVGDKLLVEIAKRLRVIFPAPNVVARFGGDEFVVFVRTLTSEAELRQAADAINELFSHTFAIDDYSFNVGASIGLSVYPRDGQSARELIQAADTAMYDVKKKRLATYQFYNDRMRETALQKLSLQQALKQAWFNREFYLVYQPQIEMQTGEITGAEALIRWQTETAKEVSPALFVPVLEEMGIIDHVGLWVIEQAFIQLGAWQKMPLAKAFSLSINLSSIQLKKLDLVEQVKTLAVQYGVQPKRVIFEVTETVMLDEDHRVTETFNMLRAEGYKFAMDDYGTGYSNLNYIDKMDFYELKIDQSFIRKMLFNETDRLIVQHTIKMAQALDMIVVAEGVETAAELAALTGYQPLSIQGYHFDRPLKAEALTQKYFLG